MDQQRNYLVIGDRSDITVVFVNDIINASLLYILGDKSELLLLPALHNEGNWLEIQDLCGLDPENRFNVLL